jgi:hypothetical protein
MESIPDKDLQETLEWAAVLDKGAPARRSGPRTFSHRNAERAGAATGFQSAAFRLCSAIVRSTDRIDSVNAVQKDQICSEVTDLINTMQRRQSGAAE